MGKRVKQQAGAVTFRIRDGHPEILVVRARRTPGAWIFPKGHIERDETADEAAVRETEEEAGVVGTAVMPLEPPLEFEAGGDRIRVQYYLVRATGEVEPSERREKRWLAPEKALARVTHEDAKELLRSALQKIQTEL